MPRIHPSTSLLKNAFKGSLLPKSQSKQSQPIPRVEERKGFKSPLDSLEKR